MTQETQKTKPVTKDELERLLEWCRMKRLGTAPGWIPEQCKHCGQKAASENDAILAVVCPHCQMAIRHHHPDELLECLGVGSSYQERILAYLHRRLEGYPVSGDGIGSEPKVHDEGCRWMLRSVIENDRLEDRDEKD